MADWRVWALAAAMLGVAALDVLLPSGVVIISFLWVPVVASALFAGARMTSLLAGLGFVLVLLAGAIGDYYRDPSYWIRFLAMGIVALIAIYLSRVTEQQQQRAALLSATDPLTKLPNRRWLLDRLDSQLRIRNRNKLVAVLFIDLDRFKAVNAEHGHSGGDTVLKEVASRLAGCLRDEDTVARFGGDEFVVSCPSISSTREVEALCTRLLHSLEDPFPLAGDIDIGATIGAVTVPPACRTSGAAVIREADELLMQLKLSEPGSYRVTAVPDRICAR